MKHTIPKVFLLSETGDLTDLPWLDHMKGTEALDHMQDLAPAEKIIELAARRCYKSFAPKLNPNVTKVRTDSRAYFENILKSGHGSVLEHASATFAFEDVSRVFTHEMVRNRAGLAYSQESLRYVRLEDLRFWIPDVIADNKEALEVFKDVISKCEWGQKELARIYDIDNKPMDVKKQLTSAFRRIAPIGLATGIVVTFNMRALRWVIEQRTSTHAEVEMRFVFNLVAEIAWRRWPNIFQDFSANSDGTWKPKYSKV